MGIKNVFAADFADIPVNNKTKLSLPRYIRLTITVTQRNLMPSSKHLKEKHRSSTDFKLDHPV